MFELASRSLEEISRSEALNSPDMLQFKKSLSDGIHHMVNLTMFSEQYKKLRKELDQRVDSTSSQTDFEADRELFQLYPHISAMNLTFRKSIDGLVKKGKDRPGGKINSLSRIRNFVLPNLPSGIR